MRFIVLYTRSRQLPAAVVIIMAIVVIADFAHDPVMTVLVPAAVASVLMMTTAAPDEEWERSMPVPWAAIRCVHIVAVAGAALLIRLVLPPYGTAGMREVLGCTGIAAVVAAFIGGWRAWMILFPYGLLANAGSGHGVGWAWFGTGAGWYVAAGAGIVGTAALACRGGGQAPVSGDQQ